MVDEILKKLIGNNGKITSIRQNFNSYLIYIKFIDYNKRNNRINKKNNTKYWTLKLENCLLPRKTLIQFKNDNNVGIWTEKIIREERKEKLKKIYYVNKE